MDESHSTQVTEVQKILRQRWLNKKNKQAEEEKEKDREIKNKEFLCRFLSKFELNRIKRNAHRIGKFTKRKLLFKLNNEDNIKKVPGYFMVRFKFTKDNLIPPIFQSEGSIDGKVKKIKRFKSKKRQLTKITEITVPSAGIAEFDPQNIPIDELAEEEQIQKAINESLNYEERILNETIKSSLKDVIPLEKRKFENSEDNDPLLMQTILNSIYSNTDDDTDSFKPTKPIPYKLNLKTEESFTYYLGFDIRDLNSKLEEPIKFNRKELYLNIQQKKYINELWMKINIDTPVGHMRLIKFRKFKSLCKDAHKRNLFIIE